ncbi:multidrug effflux MFS transporter [Halomonas marinisediminis]|uniref:Bcr/CflA family efflux transporter n=2 Tax=Gammaproteobacteria TaxID=1236 RepID=A0ABY2DB22_9GAMM|nr:multidrug effflux MFS transporter [Halomonas marinisediminis]TDB02246.1 Bcr/CflA family efflux MFS transporter [Halomonas marinisediminis]
MLRLTSPATILILAALTALGPLATDMYLPAMPSMAEALDTGPDQVQLTLSFYMAGFALAQLFVGPVSDHFGRKPVMVAGLALFLAASLLCVVAPTIEWLLVGRFLQAFGGAAGPVLARAAVRDIYDPIAAGRALSHMASTMALAPALAPAVGAGLLLFFGWESVFMLLAIYAAIMLLILILMIPEPLPANRRQSMTAGMILANYRMLLTQRSFVGYTLINASGFAGLFAFLSGSSFVLIEYMGLSPFQYGSGFVLIVAGFFFGTLCSGRYSQRLGRDYLLMLASLMCALAGTTMAILAIAGVHEPWAVIAPHVIFLFGFGIVMPQSMAGALAPNPQCAGSASSLFGFLQMTIAALGGALVGQFHDGTSRTMAIAIALGGLISFTAYAGLIRQRGKSSV